MKAKNHTAEELIKKLHAVGRKASLGYFVGTTYCIGVAVRDVSDAFNLGAAIGPDFGKIEFTRHGSQKYVVFREALASQ